MGNVSPRQSKSYHDGLNNHLSLSAASTTTTTVTTPTRSSWKKQLQLINETFNIKKFSLRHPHSRNKRYRSTFDENNPRKLSTSLTTQNFHDLMKTNRDKSTKEEQISKKCSAENHERPMSFKKSFSLFSIKQPLTDATNKETMTKSIPYPLKEKDEEQQQQKPVLNSTSKNSNHLIPTNHVLHQHKRQHKFEITTGEYDERCRSRLQLVIFFHQPIITYCFHLSVHTWLPHQIK